MLIAVRHLRRAGLTVLILALVFNIYGVVLAQRAEVVSGKVVGSLIARDSASNEPRKTRGGVQNSLRSPLHNELAKAYGYVWGQQLTIRKYLTKYPQHRSGVAQANMDFGTSSLREGFDGVENALSSMLGDRWPEFKSQFIESLNSLVHDQSATESEFVEFLDTVSKRSKGDLPEDIKRTLLSHNKRYNENPILELKEGWKARFSSRDYQHGTDADFTFSYPVTWVPATTHSESILQAFQSRAGSGKFFAKVIVSKLPAFSASEMALFDAPLTIDDVREIASAFVINATDVRPLYIGSRPGGSFKSDVSLRVMDVEAKMRTINYFTTQGDAMIYVQFSQKVPTTASEFVEFDKHEALSKVIMSTLKMH